MTIQRERNQGDDVLREDEQFTRAVLNNLFTFVGVLKPDGTLLEANTAPLAAAGITLADVQGRKFWDCHWWNYSTQAQAQVREACAAAARGETVRYDVQVRMAQDALMWIDFQLRPLLGSDGGVSHLIPSAVDITGRKRAEETLLRRLAESEALLNQMTEGLMLFDAEGNLLNMNRAALAIHGFDSDGDLRHSLGALSETVEFSDIRGNPLPADTQPISRVLRGETFRAYEVRVRRTGLDRSWIASYGGTPVYDLEGRLQLALVTLRDVTAEREAQEQMKLSRERLRHRVEEIEGLMEVVPAAVWVALDPQCQEITGNRRANELYEADSGENVSASTVPGVRRFFSPEGRELAPSELPMQLAAATNQEVRDCELHVKAPSGRSLVILGSAIPLRNDQGEVRGCIAAFMDITARKRAEEALGESQKALLELTASLERRVVERTVEVQRRAHQLRVLAAQLSDAEQKERQRLAALLHDGLQQLLVGTKYQVEMLHAELKNPRHRKMLKQMHDLLDESLHTSRNLSIDLCPPILQQGTMVDVLHWLGRWFATKQGLLVQVEEKNTVPGLDASMRTLLFQAVRELLFNVVKHAGVKHASVELRSTSSEQVQIIVSDTGAGFNYLQSPADTIQGKGLGLFTIGERLDWLGGSLRIESAPGKGTRAVICLPLRVKEPAVDASPGLAALAPPQLKTIGAARRRPEKITVLLADDHAVMRDGLASLMANEAWIEVIGQAADGQQAVDMAHQLEPDIILMDIGMPEMDGIEATRRILSARPDAKVIGLSMFSEEDVAARMRAAGAADYLAKSSSPESVIAAIRRCAGISESDALG
jgi:PAS domain S-box-containing protein